MRKQYKYIFGVDNKFFTTGKIYTGEESSEEEGILVLDCNIPGATMLALAELFEECDVPNPIKSKSAWEHERIQEVENALKDCIANQIPLPKALVDEYNAYILKRIALR